MVVKCHINIKTILQKHAILGQLIMELQDTQNYLNSNLNIDIVQYLFVSLPAQSFHKVVAERRFFSSSPLKSIPPKPP